MLLPEHTDHLVAHAITPAIIEAAGIYSITTVDELPPEFAWYGEEAVPSIVFPWRSPIGGDVILQLRPDTPIVIDGDERKYLLAKGARSVLDTVVAKGDTVLIVEGSKQHLAAASYIGTGIAVFGLMGCQQWLDEGVPIADLEVVDDKEVVVCFDADLSSNIDVWAAASGLGDALRAEGASDVKFLKLPAGRKAGLDDVLARRAPDRRGAYLARLIQDASKLPGRPRGRKKEPRRTTPRDGRARIVITQDQKQVIDEITGVLVARWSGTELFDHGGVIARRDGHVIKPLDKGAFLDTMQEAAVTVIEAEEGDVYAWPHTNCVSAALSRAAHFAPLHRVSRAPFVRPDGTICQTPGYDAATGTFLVTDLEVVVPDDPTPAQIQAAVDLILRDWLVDMPFTSQADRANVLALSITPVIRGLVELVPLAVIDGLQMGVGKNLLADCIAILATGDAIDPLPYSSDNEEMRKLITSTFRAGTDFVAFDEAHLLEGNALARTLTALYYTDRVLGVSTLARFPNRVTWLSMGNQVQIRGDVARRVYPIALRTTMANPELRPEAAFRHPNLRQWTREHRSELLSAILTLVRAWFTAGRPGSVRGASFGSFEGWGRMVGGIVELAGEKDFLGNVVTWRSESDFETAFWTAHLRWLHQMFGDKYFTCGDVRKAITAEPETAEPPPGMEDTSPKDYTRVLGQRYARQRDRILDGYQLVRSTEKAHDNANKWLVRHEDDGGGGSGGKGGTAPPPYVWENASTDERPPARARTRIGSGLEGSPPHPPHSGRLLPFDLETADADQLFSSGPNFIRLVGYRARDGEIHVGTDPTVIVEAARHGAALVGHNVLGFDIPALVKYHDLDLATVAAVDTKILASLDDPPPARMKPAEAERYYALDAVGHRLLGAGKTGDLKALAKKYGGFDRIPVDDPEYVDYVRGDVDVTARLAEHFGEMSEYARREHEVARLAAQIMLNGFRVDTDLLARRIDEGEHHRAELLRRLDHLGLPRTTKDGKRECKAPLATEEGRQIIAEAFARLGVKLPLTTSKQPGTGSGVMQRIIDAGGRAAELAEAVQALNGIRTIYETIAACLIGDRVHPSISFRQATGRWSVTKPGLTVVGKRAGRFVEREVFLPEPGHVIIAADLAQVDARAVAVHAQDPAYIAMMAPGLDLHAEIAAMIWRDRSRREEAKPMSHGFNYGEGIQTVAQTAGVTFEEAGAFIRAMRDKFRLVVDWQQRVREQADVGLLLDNGFGRKMKANPDRSWTQAPALIGQGCARDLMMEGLLRLPREVWPFLRGVIHDEVVLSVPEDIVDDVERVVLDALSFEWAPEGADIPIAIVAELGRRRGRNWGEIYRKESP